LRSYICTNNIQAMKNLFEPQTQQEIISRINTLSANSPRQWGSMDAAQMLAHAAIPLEYALGDKNGKQSLIGKIFKPFAKNVFFEEKPYKPNLPTAPEFRINVATDQKQFDAEKKKLIDVLHRFQGEGKNEFGKHPHIFLGKITPDEWARTMYKHLDHHLRQFGA